MPSFTKAAQWARLETLPEKCVENGLTDLWGKQFMIKSVRAALTLETLRGDLTRVTAKILQVLKKLVLRQKCFVLHQVTSKQQFSAFQCPQMMNEPAVNV